jgi:vacuolar-type H+-ATPase subunit I/STV1
MKEWEPIVKKPVLEPFRTEIESQSIVGAVFTGIGLMALAAFLSILFYWTYQKDKTLFIAIFSALMFLFAVKMVILVAVLRNKLNAIVFRIYMGSTVFASLLCAFNLVFFSIKASQRLGSSSSSSVPSYAPPAYNPPMGEA